MSDVGAFECLDPAWLRSALNSAKDEYLLGDISKAEERLSKYVELVDLLESKADPAAPYDENLVKLRSLRDEMRSLLNRIASNLDYFGNPAGWVPMLSFEVNQAAFQGEVDHALNLMYLTYWVSKQNRTATERNDGLAKMWNDLAKETQDLQTEYDTLLGEIPKLHVRAEQNRRMASVAAAEMVSLVQELRRKATENSLDDMAWMASLSGRANWAAPQRRAPAIHSRGSTCAGAGGRPGGCGGHV